jgi:hypothetical protein
MCDICGQSGRPENSDFGVKKVSDLVVTSDKLTNNFTSLVKRSLGLDVASG